MYKKKINAARLSILSNSFLILIKLSAGIISGSISVLSEALHSAMDLIAAIIAFFAIKISNKPPDKTHPYGHGKFENVSGVLEALLIFGAAIWIIYESILSFNSEKNIDFYLLAIIVMAFSALINFFVSRHLYKVAHEGRSIALEADALHLKTDVLTSIGVLVGLIIIWLTGYTFLDPLIAISVALYIMYEAYIILKKAFNPLIDKALPENEEKIIAEIINSYNLKFHGLKTRQSGHFRFIEFHLEMPPDIFLKDLHDKCNIIEDDIKNKLSDSHITIHVEPNNLLQ